MNATIEQLLQHRSIRQFTDQAIDPETLEQLLLAGQSAATSSFLQCTSIVQVSDADKRQRLSDIAGGQKYVSSSAEFLVFCADMRRAELCCEQRGIEFQSGFVEQLLIASVDVGLFAQNVVVAAESMGLGICYIGALRNDPQAVCDLLQLPEHVYPVFGLCLGHPAQESAVKPRLPLSVILHENAYDDEKAKAALADYDAHMSNYYASRGSNVKQSDWSTQVSGLVGSKESRPHMAAFLKRQGFNQR